MWPTSQPGGAEPRNRRAALTPSETKTLTDVNAAWTTADKLAEIGDLCGPAGNLNLSRASCPVTSLWSNLAHACVIRG